MELTPQDDEIREKIITVIRDVLKPGTADLTFDKRFIEDLGADSLDRVSLIMALEQEFKTTISDEEAASLTTIGAVFNFVKQRPAGVQA